MERDLNMDSDCLSDVESISSVSSIKQEEKRVDSPVFLVPNSTCPTKGDNSLQFKQSSPKADVSDKQLLQKFHLDDFEMNDPEISIQ